MESKIKELVEEITIRSVDMDTPLFSSGLIDSLGIVDLATMLEDEYSLVIDTRDIVEKNFDTLERILDYIRGRING